MATKIERAAGKAAAPASNAAADKAARELEVLHPEREFLVDGRLITMREYGFVEGMKMLAIAKPFMDALYETHSRVRPMPTFYEIEQLLVDHQDCVLKLMAQAANVEVVWIEGLSDDDGSLLLQNWWVVNSRFFTRRLVTRLGTDRALARLAGVASTQPSSDTATDAAQQKSGDTPPGS